MEKAAMETWMLYILAGLAAGIISAMFGVGGGVLMVPILVLGFSFGQKSAQGMSLFIMLPMALAGAVRYKLNPNVPVNFPVCGLVALGGIAGAMIGSHIVFNLPEIMLKRIFAVFIILTGIYMMFKTLPGPELKEAQHADHPTQRTDG
jgi:uncharacterized membrane protein YfcA